MLDLIRGANPDVRGTLSGRGRIGAGRWPAQTLATCSATAQYADRSAHDEAMKSLAEARLDRDGRSAAITRCARVYAEHSQICGRHESTL